MTASALSLIDRLRPLDDVLWELPAETRPDMRVPARVFADRELLAAVAGDRSLEQLQNVATLPGIVDAALAMPDFHQGYGFPVGGVAAIEAPDGVVSPGGVGYDINCGVRLLTLPVTADELGARREPLVHEIARSIPAGTGRRSDLLFEGPELDRLLREGPRYLVETGIGTPTDVEHTESEGCLEDADPSAVSERARLRGRGEIATVGSGNHFIELQRVDGILDAATAEAFGLREGQATVLIHSGSRGLGHQVCTDYVRLMEAAQETYGIELPDRQLACAPLSSPEGRAYLAAMAAAANFAWANRHAMAHRVRESIRRILGDGAADGTRQVYDVAHNVAKLERHGGRLLCVHRKGATRAFPAGSVEIPDRVSPGGPAGLHPGQHGHRELRARGRARLARALVREHLPRGRPAPEPDEGPAGGGGRDAQEGARGPRHRRPLPLEPRSRRGGAGRLQGRRPRRYGRGARGARPAGRAPSADRSREGMSSRALDDATPPLFEDRADAGRRLADALSAAGLDDGLVVGLARGGIVTAAAVAECLGLPLDVLAVRKVGHPAQPEYAIGAVTPGGGRFLRDAEDLTGPEVAGAVAEAQERAEELDRRLHAAHGALDPAGKAVLLVDDGLATGATMTAAVRWARHAGADRVAVAVPVGPTETVAALAIEADDVVCPEQPRLFGAVGLWYERFPPVGEEEVVALLAAARTRSQV